MKKFTALLLALVMSMSLAACSVEKVDETSSTSGSTSYHSGCASPTSMPKRVMSPMTPCGTERGLP